MKCLLSPYAICHLNFAFFSSHISYIIVQYILHMDDDHFRSYEEKQITYQNNHGLQN